MRRVMLLAPLSTAASASTIQLFSITPTQFIDGIVTVNFAPTFQVLARGATSPGVLPTIRTLGATTLSPGCMTSPGTCTFSTGKRARDYSLGFLVRIWPAT